MILVVGASGEIGGLVLEYLSPTNESIKAATRNPTLSSTNSKINSENITWTPFDFQTPSTFAPALQNVDKVFLYLNVNLDKFITAAKLAGVKLIVFLSTVGLLLPNDPERVNFEKKYHFAEDLIASSGIPYVFLRSGEFCKNELRFLSMIKDGVVKVCYPMAKSYRIHERDVAEVAVAALTRPKLVGSKLTLIGNQPVSTVDTMNIISPKLNKEIVVEECSETDTALYLKDQRMPDHVVATYVEFKRDAMEGNKYIPEPVDVEKVLGKPPRTFQDWVEENVSMFE
ncbi:hypothetical protein HK098_007439 [Nowakowskiella sp. JEL0407]|nr:hypothetical protein HK098_007439 [Nowakowskiella sp. JEL0407]